MRAGSNRCMQEIGNLAKIGLCSVQEMTLPEISLLVKFSKNSLFTDRIHILRFHLVSFLC